MVWRWRIWPSNTTCTKSRPRRKGLFPDIYVPTNDEHWTVTLETRKHAAAAGSFCFVTTENGEQQDICNLATMPCVQRSLHLDEVINDSSNTQVEVPTKGRQSNQRHAGTLYGHLWKSTGSKGPEEISCSKKKHQLRKYEDTTNSLLKRNIFNTHPGLSMRFLISFTGGRSNRGTTLRVPLN